MKEEAPSNLEYGLFKIRVDTTDWPFQGFLKHEIIKLTCNHIDLEYPMVVI